MSASNGATGITDGPLSEDAEGACQSTCHRYRSNALPQCCRSKPTRYSGDPAGGAVHPVAEAGSTPFELTGESR